MAENRELDSWKTSTFRKRVLDEIQQAIEMYGNPTSNAAEEIEHHICHKANNKDEYLSLLTRFKSNVQEIHRNKKMTQNQNTYSNNNQNSDPNCWRKITFRMSVCGKIEETFQKFGNPTTKTVQEVENHCFLKARTKEEYLSFVARLILYTRELGSKREQNRVQEITDQFSVIDLGSITDECSDSISSSPEVKNQSFNLSRNLMQSSVSNSSNNSIESSPSPTMSQCFNVSKFSYENSQ